MRFICVLNRDGGTLRTLDRDAFARQMQETLAAAGHEAETRVVAPRTIEKALKEAAAEPDCDVVIAGGGDGTVSTAARCLMDARPALAILPAGTMNLFARTLGIPLDLEAAVEAFANGVVRKVDMASANGRPYVHQFSIGMHAKLVSLRSRMSFETRLGKMRASAQAAVETILRPPVMRIGIEIDGEEISVDTNGVGISNNVFGEGHLPFADRPDGGELGIYIAQARSRPQMLRLVAGMALGRWRQTEEIKVRTAREIVLHLPPRARRRRACVIDGELCDLEQTTVLKIHPRALKVLVPRGESA